MEKNYKIVGRTNGWIANRDIHFNGKTEITIESNLTLREAQKKLLKLFNKDYDTNYQNWGLVRCKYDDETTSRPDGTRSYEYDSRYYSIEEDNKEKWYCSSYAMIKTGDGEYTCPDCDYFIAKNDEEAIELAKDKAKEGVDYTDEGHFELDLISVCRVDPEREWDEVETIWY